MPVILALLLNEVRMVRFKRISQTITYIPYFISTVIVVGMLRTIFGNEGGTVNALRNAAGLDRIDFYNSTGWFRPLYIGSGIWQYIGYGSILYLAAITGIDPQLYEAAKMDGASRIRCVLAITIPCIVPTVAVLFTLRVGAALNVGFEKVLLMQTPATYSVSDVISTYVYRLTFNQIRQDFSYSAAVGLFNSVVSLAMVAGGNWFSKRVLGESLW
jgi:putative aldouronate transport system permease protein